MSSPTSSCLSPYVQIILGPALIPPLHFNLPTRSQASASPFSTSDMLALLWRAILCVVGCLAASPTSVGHSFLLRLSFLIC